MIDRGPVLWLDRGTFDNNYEGAISCARDGHKSNSMAKGVSEIVGKAGGAGKSSVTVYRALKRLLCAPCGEPIAEGALFTRRSLYGRGLRILPQCRKCAPFSLRNDEAKRVRSAMLESLLSAPPEKSGGKEPPDGEAVREAVEKRLGPALGRARR